MVVTGGLPPSGDAWRDSGGESSDVWLVSAAASMRDGKVLGSTAHFDPLIRNDPKGHR